MLKRILFLALLLAFPLSLHAATYYVDWATGVDSNNGTATGTPWKHSPGDTNATGNANITLAAGDTVVFKGGVSYQGTHTDPSCGSSSGTSIVYPNASGASGNPITFISGDVHSSAWGTGRAVLDGGSARKWGVLIGGKTYITIKGFEIKNIGAPTSQAAGIEVDCSDNATIQSNLIHDINWSGTYIVAYGIENNDSAFMTAEKNEIYNATDKLIELYSSNNATSNSSTSLTRGAVVRYNILHDAEIHCAVFTSDGSQFYNNVLWQCGNGGPLGTDAHAPDFSFKIDQGRSNQIFNNIAYDVGTGFGVLIGNNNTFAHNIVYGVGLNTRGPSGSNEDACFVFFIDGPATPVPWSSGTMDSNKFYNNICYYIPVADSVAYPKFIFFQNDLGSSNEVKNNIFYALSGDTTATTNRVRFYNGSNNYLSISDFQTAFNTDEGGTGNVASGNQVVDPAFMGGTLAAMTGFPTGFTASYSDVNTSAFDLTASSPAKSTGITVASPMNVDLRGVTRVNFWMGVYDSSGGTATQYAFRFRNDDGSESTATWAEAENTNFGASTDTVKRVRVGIDTTSTLGAQAFQLEAKKSTDSTYQAVPASTPTQQTVTYSTAGSGTGTIPAWVTSIQIECVGGGGAGSRSSTGGQGRGGGAGGTYAIETSLAVTAGATYSYTVGAAGTSGASPANGGFSSFTYNSTDYCKASGGVSASADTSAGATASTTGSIGDTITAGSNGGTGNGTTSGAGGAGGTPLGGAGGAGVTGDSVGVVGTAPGGAGSGGRSVTPTITQPFTSSQTWTRPSSVTSITSAQCWGPGGNGGTDTSTANTPGGGGGGAYAIRANVGVSAASYPVTVGATAGNTTSFTGTSIGCSAGSGSSAAQDNPAGGAGSTTGTGDTVRNGGNGGTGGASSGGGGEGGCTTGNGNAASGATGGSGCDGGNGANGVSGNTNGAAGSVTGGGGSGGHRNNGGSRPGGAGARGAVTLIYDDPGAATARDGGAGAAGQVKITYTAAPYIVLAASANIAAGGNTATTAQLTAPSMKTTASFDPGKISDDTNPVPSVTVSASFYTELEYAFKMLSANVAGGDSFNFRITKSGTALDTYSVTPTVTASGTAITIETAANGSGSVIGSSSVEGGAVGTLVGYCISRASGVFQSNVACTWSLTNKTSGVVDGDLVPAGDTKSATFTGHALGTATIHAISGALTADTGTVTVVDTTAPTPGNSGTITTSGITSSNITLNWTKATDLVWAQSTLQYIVYRSSTGNIDNITNAEANGTVQMAYTADVNTFDVTGPQITPSTTFYFAIIVKDGSGNKAFYSMISESTLAATDVVGAAVFRLSR